MALVENSILLILLTIGTFIGLQWTVKSHDPEIATVGIRRRRLEFAIPWTVTVIVVTLIFETTLESYLSLLIVAAIATGSAALLGFIAWAHQRSLWRF